MLLLDSLLNNSLSDLQNWTLIGNVTGKNSVNINFNDYKELYIIQSAFFNYDSEQYYRAYETNIILDEHIRSIIASKKPYLYRVLDITIRQLVMVRVLLA